ncbi:hypothetical protein TWF506_000218 [Arthrobotrys conoides]|uniref:Uncharacterized protein n=1 Tax=Arthrobotrys conoides TaxID=74498 RepID=A0AAN8NDF9_9PEZI
MVVMKKGCSTGLTFGKINGVKLNVKLQNSQGLTAEWISVPLEGSEIDHLISGGVFSGFRMTETLSRPLVMEVFACVGDSGSFVIDTETLKVVGMVIGGLPTRNPPLTAITPFHAIFGWMNSRLRRQGIGFGDDCLKV